MHRASLIWQADRRLKRLTAYGLSRHASKQTGRTAWSHSTGLIHSRLTLESYAPTIFDYCRWARARGIRRIDRLDDHAPELVSAYLRYRMASVTSRGTSPSAYSLQQYRSALRLFHRPRYPQEAELGRDVPLPRRRRAGIINNRGLSLVRGPTSSVNLTTHHELVAFLLATGLRRREVTALRVKHIETLPDDDGRGAALYVHITNGKGGRERWVRPRCDPTLVLRLIADRNRQDLVFAQVPDRLRIHVLRRLFAQASYLEEAGVTTLPTNGVYDPEALRVCSEQLGHSRLDVVVQHYLL